MFDYSYCLDTQSLLLTSTKIVWTMLKKGASIGLKGESADRGERQKSVRNAI